MQKSYITIIVVHRSFIEWWPKSWYSIQYHRKVLLSSFHLSGHTSGFHPQTQKLESLSSAPLMAQFFSFTNILLCLFLPNCTQNNNNNNNENNNIKHVIIYTNHRNLSYLFYLFGSLCSLFIHFFVYIFSQAVWYSPMLVTTHPWSRALGTVALRSSSSGTMM